MLFTLTKAVVSALIILFVTWIAKKLPTFGGWIAALPLVSLLSAFWLSLGGQNYREIADFLTGVLWGLLPRSPLTCYRSLSEAPRFISFIHVTWY